MDMDTVFLERVRQRMESHGWRSRSISDESLLRKIEVWQRAEIATNTSFWDVVDTVSMLMASVQKKAEPL